ncbi:hypothetical protein GVAV_000318 [Gurleya vavrai]
MNQKRQFPPRETKEIIIDETFLIKTYHLVLETELNLFVNYPYKKYLDEFYSNKIKKFYTLHFQNKWFNERYLNKNKSQIDYKEKLENFYEKIKEIGMIDLDKKPEKSLFEKNKNNIIACGNLAFESIESIYDFCKKCPNFKDLQIVVDFQKHTILRKIIILLDENANVFESLAFLGEMADSSTEFIPLIIENIKYNEIDIKTEEIDVKYLKELLSKFSAFYDVELFYDDSKNIDFYINLMRYVFKYCFYCQTQFDSEIEMLSKCGDFHLRKPFKCDRIVFDRKNEIICREKNLNHLRPRPVLCDALLFFTKKSENGIQCNSCLKEFETEETIQKHLTKKHPEKIEMLQKDFDHLNTFFDNMDIKFFNNIEGMEDNNLPLFLKYAKENDFEKNLTVYDMGKIFSGEIKLNK